MLDRNVRRQRARASRNSCDTGRGAHRPAIISWYPPISGSVRILLRIHVDQLDDPVAVGAARRCEEVRDDPVPRRRRSPSADRSPRCSTSGRRGRSADPRPATSIQPAPERDGPRTIRHRVRRIRDDSCRTPSGLAAGGGSNESLPLGLEIEPPFGDVFAGGHASCRTHSLAPVLNVSASLTGAVPCPSGNARGTAPSRCWR